LPETECVHPAKRRHTIVDVWPVLLLGSGRQHWSSGRHA
jgi:hypothetical protein